MPRRTTQGLVLESAAWGDSSLRLSVFARDIGGLGLIARGARRRGRGAHALSGAEPFASGRFTFSRRSEEAMGTLVEFDPESPRMALRLDLDAYAAGALALELLARDPSAGEHAAEALDRAGAFLDRLDSLAMVPHSAGLESVDGRRVAICEALGRFLLAELDLSGHGPRWSECVVTRRPMAALAPSKVSVALGGRVSPEGERLLAQRRPAHAGDDAPRPLSPETLLIAGGWLGLLTPGELALLPDGFRPRERPLNLLAVFVRYHLDVPLRSYDYLHTRLFGAAPK